MTDARLQLNISGLDRGRQLKWKQWAESNYQVDCYVIGQAKDSLPGILAEYDSNEPVTAWVCLGMKCLPPARSREALKQRLETCRI